MGHHRRLPNFAEGVGNIVELFGQINGRLSVNSAQPLNPEAVYDFPQEAMRCGEGSISLDWIKQQTGADLFGAVAIRRYIEETAVLVRGAPYTKRHANNIKTKLDFLGNFMGIGYTRTNSLNAAVKSHIAAVNEERKKCGSLLADSRRVDRLIDSSTS